MEASEPPISGSTLSIFCHVTVLENDDSEASLAYEWMKDGATLTDADKYIGLGTEQINITVSSIVRHAWYEYRASSNAFILFPMICHALCVALQILARADIC